MRPNQFAAFYSSQQGGLRQTLGQVRGNQTQHRRAKHNGRVDPKCAVCARLERSEAHWTAVLNEFISKSD